MRAAAGISGDSTCGFDDGRGLLELLKDGADYSALTPKSKADRKMWPSGFCSPWVHVRALVGDVSHGCETAGASTKVRFLDSHEFARDCAGSFAWLEHVCAGMLHRLRVDH